MERFSIDHVVARKHGGTDDPENLAYSCLRCNLHKGTDLAARDPIDGIVVPLFNPRNQEWSDHFALDGPHVRGISPIGRAAVQLLDMNAAERVRLRASLQ